MKLSTVVIIYGSLNRSSLERRLSGREFADTRKLFVDYTGSTVPIVNALTGEISAAQIFVATLGASNYTFACATPRQTTADWIGAQVSALEFIGGVPRLIVPDQMSRLPFGARRTRLFGQDPGADGRELPAVVGADVRRCVGDAHGHAAGPSRQSVTGRGSAPWPNSHPRRARRGHPSSDDGPSAGTAQ